MLMHNYETEHISITTSAYLFYKANRGHLEKRASRRLAGSLASHYVVLLSRGGR